MLHFLHEHKQHVMNNELVLIEIHYIIVLIHFVNVEFVHEYLHIRIKLY
jgi:hypothetical protein